MLFGKGWIGGEPSFRTPQGSVRRECLDRLMILGRRQLEQILRVYIRPTTTIGLTGLSTWNHPTRALGQPPDPTRSSTIFG